MAVHAVTLMHCLALLGWTENPAQSPGQFTKKPEAQKAQKREDRAISIQDRKKKGKWRRNDECLHL